MPGFPYDTIPDPLPSGLASDLPRAIVERFDATAALDWIDGGITYGLAQTDADRYVEFHFVGDQFSWTTCPEHVKQVTYQFNCYGPSDDEAERMVEGLVLAFNHRMARLAFVGGTTTMARPGTGMKDPAEYVAPSGLRLRRQHLDIAFTANRVLS